MPQHHRARAPHAPVNTSDSTLASALLDDDAPGVSMPPDEFVSILAPAPHPPAAMRARAANDTGAQAPLHQVVGTLTRSELTVTGGLATITLTLAQAERRYTAQPVLALRSYSLGDRHRAYRHAAQLEGWHGKLLVCSGSALVQGACGLHLLGVCRIALAHDAGTSLAHTSPTHTSEANTPAPGTPLSWPPLDAPPPAAAPQAGAGPSWSTQRITGLLRRAMAGGSTR